MNMQQLDVFNADNTTNQSVFIQNPVQHSAQQHSVLDTNTLHPQQSGRITQWLCSGYDYRPLLLPTLAWQTHNNDERWVTWIAAKFIDKETLQNYKVNLSNLRMIVDSSNDYSSFKLLLTALRNQRSSTVVASLPAVSTEQYQQLEVAASEGNSIGLIIVDNNSYQ